MNLRIARDTVARRILLVDDHTLFAEGMSLLLEALSAGVTVHHARTCEEALSLLERDAAWDLILFDLVLPGVSYIAAFRELAALARGVPLVALSADDRPRVVAEVLRAGARGYIPKSTGGEVTLSAIRLVLAGGTYVPAAALTAQGTEPFESKLTTRELEVLEQVRAGLSNKEIAAALGTADSTIRVHVTSILRRLGLSSRHELATSPMGLSLREAGRCPRERGA